MEKHLGNKMFRGGIHVCLLCLIIGCVIAESEKPNVLNKPVVCDESRPLTAEERLILEEALKEAQRQQELTAEQEMEETKNKVPGSDKGTIEAKLDSLHGTTSEYQEKGREALKCSRIAGHLPMSSKETISLKGTEVGNHTCFTQPDCSHYENYPYRTMDGRCNNLMNGLAGMAGTPSVRLLPAAYGEFKERTDMPRTRDDRGRRLAHARTISDKVFKVAEVFTPDISIMAMQWGQFVDHDVTKTPVFQAFGEEGKLSNIQCCKRVLPKQTKDSHPECFPIKVDRGDVFRKYRVGCINFVRSLPAPDINCILSTRQQMNSISHFIDASNVYGSSEVELEDLRDGRRLLTQNGNLLPRAKDTDECPKRGDQYCFLAGDGRANEQTGLTMMHTIWMREHNRISDFIAQKSPNCSDEEIFQITRRLVSAEIQHITYNEYLRLILGEDYLVTNELAPETNIEGAYPYYPNYNDTIDPSIANAFSTAAYRFGHSMIRGFVEFHSEDGLEEGRLLRSQFFSPYGMYDKNFRSGLSRGLGRSVAQKADEAFSPEVSKHLFQGEDDLIGLDVRALNIQRGRDHGLPPYNHYRKFCNLNKVNTFDEFTGQGFEQSQEVKWALMAVYKHPKDIDLFVGGMLEKPVKGTSLGPTFLCIIGDQFQRLKIADRYFYDNNAQPEPFTVEQLVEIKTKLTLASVMCLNRDDDVQTTQKDIFKSPSASSGLVNCDDIPAIDLNLFIPH